MEKIEDEYIYNVKSQSKIVIKDTQHSFWFRSNAVSNTSSWIFGASIDGI